ncbi:MAG: expansin EXLX1 family cellulose-binding protein [Nakamurella multipartita]|jgi:endoglucanase
MATGVEPINPEFSLLTESTTPLAGARRPRRRTAVALLIGAVAASLLLAAPPAAAATSGKATHYEATGGSTTNGNCSFPALPADKLYVAVSPTEYAKGAACGTYLDVTGPRGTVRVVVMDKCPECATGHIDLSKTAFAKIGALSDGIIPVTYSTVKNPTVPALNFRFKNGSSRWWFALQVLNHGNRLQSVSVQVNGKWVAATLADYNYWIYQPGAGPGPYTLLVKDIYGQQAIVSGVTMSPTLVQTTTARLK